MAGKGLHDRKTYSAFAGGLPAATLNEQWEALVAKVGGKVFCLRSEACGDLVFKVSELAFDGLVELSGIAQAPYFAKRQWVRVEPGALEDELLRGYILESHRIIAGKLTRKARAELGL
jgi:predicted DNA-binding protein (MmcQ/YjbR family)